MSAHIPPQDIARPETNPDNPWTTGEAKAAFRHYWTTSKAYQWDSSKDHCTGKVVCKFQTEPYHSLGCLEAPTPGLEEFVNGPLHPILSRDNFITDIPDTLFNVFHGTMRPALHLVSEILQNEYVSRWFVRVAYGARVETGSDTFSLKETSEQRERMPELKQKVRIGLLKLAKNIRFTFTGRKVMGNAGASCLGTLKGLFKYLNGPDYKFKSTIPKDETHITIVLHLNLFWAQYCLAQNAKALTSSQKLRVHIGLAAKIIHELGHAWHKHCHGNFLTEPLVFPSESFSELGFSLQQYVFGASFNAAAYGWTKAELAIYPVTVTRFEDQYPYAIHMEEIASMRWVAAWFDKSTWVTSNPQDEIRRRVPMPLSEDLPRIFCVTRYRDGRLERDVHPQFQKGATSGECVEWCVCHEFRRSGAKSVREWYLDVWAREAKAAYDAKILPKMFFTPVGAYAHLFPGLKPPSWAREQDS